MCQKRFILRKIEAVAFSQMKKVKMVMQTATPAFRNVKTRKGDCKVGLSTAVHPIIVEAKS
jgi:hypothetical protein